MKSGHSLVRARYWQKSLSMRKLHQIGHQWTGAAPDRAASVASSSRAGTTIAARAGAAGGRVAARGRSRTAGGSVVHQFGDVANARRTARCRSRFTGGEFACAGLTDARFAMAARAGVVSRAAAVVSTAGQPHGCGTQDGAKADDSEALHFDSFRSVHGRDLRAPVVSSSKTAEWECVSAHMSPRKFCSAGRFRTAVRQPAERAACVAGPVARTLRIQSVPSAPVVVRGGTTRQTGPASSGHRRD